MFINGDDLQKRYPEALLNEICVPDAMENAIEFATAEARNYLAFRYDVAYLFDQVGDRRDAALVNYIVSMTIYKLCERLEADRIPKQLLVANTNAHVMLQKIASGEVTPDWPRKPDISGKSGQTTSISPMASNCKIDWS